MNLQFQTFALIAAGSVIAAGLILLIIRRMIFPPRISPELPAVGGGRRWLKGSEEVGEKPELVDVWAGPRAHLEDGEGEEEGIEGGARWQDLMVRACFCAFQISKSLTKTPILQPARRCTD